LDKERTAKIPPSNSPLLAVRSLFDIARRPPPPRAARLKRPEEKEPKKWGVLNF